MHRDGRQAGTRRERCAWDEKNQQESSNSTSAGHCCLDRITGTSIKQAGMIERCSTGPSGRRRKTAAIAPPYHEERPARSCCCTPFVADSGCPNCRSTTSCCCCCCYLALLSQQQSSQRSSQHPACRATQHAGGAWGLAVAAGAGAGGGGGGGGGGGCGRAITAAAFRDKLGVGWQGGHARQLLQADRRRMFPAWHRQRGAREVPEWSSVVCCYEAQGTSAATEAWATRAAEQGRKVCSVQLRSSVRLSHSEPFLLHLLFFAELVWLQLTRGPCPQAPAWPALSGSPAAAQAASKQGLLKLFRVGKQHRGQPLQAALGGYSKGNKASAVAALPH